ncbi:DsrE/DsrF/TusD sulfur relay family protein [Sulfuritalea hydrogenivorans]|uniref:DsrE family protein n=1 Tax=Sulfuritalea hydrogenivorans sk43H TaxID=1223802 RepID=W0SDG1_9PROT|nr:DsrE family protein [Sulfuritalea hydrogenivorans]MDK9714993.1 DsrE family protein [Sulfuritalea sp.]BAO28785.1 DsrE family protein [Sulfuritalea hydrogenivorans sk43H]
MNTLLILNGAPYGSEHTYNGLRLARSLLKTGKTDVRVFLMGDAASGAHGGQKVPQGYYNIADMLGMLVAHNAEVAVCGTCMDARGITDAELVDGARRGSMDQLTQWTLAADKVLSF